MNSDLLYDIYMFEKQGVTIGIRAGRFVRSSSCVVSVVWQLNIVVVFSYYCSLCREQRMKYIFEDENILSVGEL